MGIRRAAALGLAGLGVAAGVVVVPSVAAAATCTHPSWSNKDSDTGKVTSSSWVPVRTGPNAGCAVEVNVSKLNVLSYDCYTVNSAGNTWTHIATASGRRGWIYDGTLNDGGSYKHC